MKLYDPKFGKDELKAVKRVLDSGQLSHGEEVEKFEVSFAKYVGSKYAVAVDNCSAALFLSLMYDKTFNGAKVATIPSVTFVSVANAVRQAGLILDFTDNIHVGFQYPILNTNVVDSAHELYRGIYKKMKDSLMCFSFYPTKLLGGAEGGAIATNSKKAYTWLRKARAHGMERKSTWNYTVEFPGWKMNMTNIQAAILNVRLKKLDTFNEQRAKIAETYRSLLAFDTKRPMHIMPIFVRNRARAIAALAKKGIETSVHFLPIHLQPAYKRRADLSVSEFWGKNELSLPIHENMSYTDVKTIVMEAQKWI